MELLCYSHVIHSVKFVMFSFPFKKKLSEEQLAAALKDLKSGQLLRETASIHNIPRSTLYVRARAEGIPITVTRQEHSGDNVNAAVEAVNSKKFVKHLSSTFIYFYFKKKCF